MGYTIKNMAADNLRKARYKLPTKKETCLREQFVRNEIQRNGQSPSVVRIDCDCNSCLTRKQMMEESKEEKTM